MRNLVTEVVRQFDVGHSTAHVGVLRYSNNAEITLYLNDSRLLLMRIAYCLLCLM